jgi:hypothetical protein
MKVKWLLAVYGMLAVLLPVQESRANIFIPPQQPTRLKRLLLGAMYANWDVAGFSGGRGLGKVDLSARSSPLITADYYLNDHLSVGAWYNPVGLSGRVGGVTALDGTAHFWDAHATWYFKHGLSVQSGLSHISENLKTTTTIGGSEPGTIALSRGRRLKNNKTSVNLWLSKTQTVTHGLHGLTLYGSFGYYPSSDFDHALNIIAGGSVGLLPNISLTGSVWWYNLQGQVETRATVGIAARF